MLSKIIKYEFKSTGRYFILIYAGLIVITLLNTLVLPWVVSGAGSKNAAVFSSLEVFLNILSGIAVFLYVIGILATIVMTYVIIVIRYYRMLGDEGYLWFTLPAKTNSHILGKLFAAFTWNAATFVIVTASIFALVLSAAGVKDIADFWYEITTSGISIYGWLALILLTLIISSVSSILQFYAAISIGPHIIKNRVGGSVLAYIIINISGQIIYSVAMFVVMIPISRYGIDTALDFTNDNFGSPAYSALAGGLGGIDYVGYWILGSAAVISALIAAACYFLSHRFINKKLNLA